MIGTWSSQPGGPWQAGAGGYKILHFYPLWGPLCAQDKKGKKGKGKGNATRTHILKQPNFPRQASPRYMDVHKTPRLEIRRPLLARGHQAAKDGKPITDLLS